MSISKELRVLYQKWDSLRRKYDKYCLELETMLEFPTIQKSKAQVKNHRAKCAEYKRELHLLLIEFQRLNIYELEYDTESIKLTIQRLEDIL